MREGQCLGGSEPQHDYVRKRQFHLLVTLFLSESMVIRLNLFLVASRAHFLASLLVLSWESIGTHELAHYSQQLCPEPEQLVTL